MRSEKSTVLLFTMLFFTVFASVSFGEASTIPSIHSRDTYVLKGKTGTINAVFNITLSAPSSQTVTVNYATTDDTAIAGTD